MMTNAIDQDHQGVTIEAEVLVVGDTIVMLQGADRHEELMIEATEAEDLLLDQGPDQPHQPIIGIRANQGLLWRSTSHPLQLTLLSSSEYLQPSIGGTTARVHEWHLDGGRGVLISQSVCHHEPRHKLQMVLGHPCPCSTTMNPIDRISS